MASYVESAIRLYDKLDELVGRQSKWSQETFGTDAERGPIGALRHLELEAREAAESPDRIEEYADCLLLLLDATRRAGWKLETLVDAALVKQKVNQSREWPKPTEAETPIEHVRT